MKAKNVKLYWKSYNILMKPNMYYEKYITIIVHFLLHFYCTKCLCNLLEVLLHFSGEFSLLTNKIEIIIT